MKILTDSGHLRLCHFSCKTKVAEPRHQVHSVLLTLWAVPALTPKMELLIRFWKHLVGSFCWAMVLVFIMFSMHSVLLPPDYLIRDRRLHSIDMRPEGGSSKRGSSSTNWVIKQDGGPKGMAIKGEMRLSWQDDALVLIHTFPGKVIHEFR